MPLDGYQICEFSLLQAGLVDSLLDTALAWLLLPPTICFSQFLP
jgi:hypothetical protein